MITAAKWTDADHSFISAYIDGLGTCIPNDMENADRQRIAAWELEGGVIAPFELLAVDLTEYAARRRWELIEAGSVSVGGASVPTAKDTRDIVTAAYIKAKLDSAFVVDPWKVGPGQYVTLDAAAIVAIGDAITAYVQDMFARNRMVDEAIAADTITTMAEVDTVLIT